MRMRLSDGFSTPILPWSASTHHANRIRTPSIGFMSDDLWAAREGDALLHTSVMADILGGVLEVATYAAITTVGCLAVAAAVFLATGATIATGGVAFAPVKCLRQLPLSQTTKSISY